MIPALEIHSLTMAYNERPVLWDVDFSIPTGSLNGIIGPNGSGKTTLLKGAIGLVEPLSGWVKFFGQPLDDVRHRVAYVPQRQSVDWNFPFTVLDVCLMGRYAPGGWFRRASRADRELAMHCLEQTGMQSFARRQIAQLSGGQQQRVFLARALAQESELYLLDEPFAGVDAASEESIIGLLRNLRNAGKTVVIVHHDLQSAAAYFDNIAMINTRLVAFGPAQTVLSAENLAKAYGAQLTFLTELATHVKSNRYPVREKPGKA